MLVTGAARGQGRNHCVRMAEEGADVIALDRCGPEPAVSYSMPDPDDLAETVSLVEATGRRCVGTIADVRDEAAMIDAISRAVAELGRLDTVVANAGICAVSRWDELRIADFRSILDVNLTGAWCTATASIPHLLAAGGGSLLFVSSAAGLRGLPFFAAYSASKQGLSGLMESLALELAESSVRVNTIHPTGVATVMTSGLSGLGDAIARQPQTAPLFENSLPMATVEMDDISAAVIFLASDQARAITGLKMSVDAGMSIR